MGCLAWSKCASIVAEAWSCQDSHRICDQSVLKQDTGQHCSGWCKIFSDTLQAGSQSALINFGRFFRVGDSHAREEQVTNAPKWVQNSGSFHKPLGSQEMLFKKLLLCKKVI